MTQGLILGGSVVYGCEQSLDSRFQSSQSSSHWA